MIGLTKALRGCLVEARGCLALSTTSAPQSWIFSSDAGKSSGHSSLLSKSDTVFEVVTESVAPKNWDEYVKRKAGYFEVCEAKSDFKFEHCGSWHFVYGDMAFRAMHLVRYNNGWNDVDCTRMAKKEDPEYQKERRSSLKLITQQHNELHKGFSFWPEPEKRSGQNIYDVRSYKVKPGSMYDWGNYWARGIKCRTQVRSDIPYAGFFTQLGKIHTIYHMWVYADLTDRKDCRMDTWHNPEWNEIVANTVPLIKSMETRILEPLPFSPTK